MTRAALSRLLAILAVLWLTSLVLFGWLAVEGARRASDAPLAIAAANLAAFPGTAGETLTQLYQDITGDSADIHNRVPHDRDLSGFAPVPVRSNIAIPGLRMAADPVAAGGHWRLIAGFFQIDGRPRNAILMMSPDREIVHHWLVEEPADTGLPIRDEGRKVIHGMEILRDGSVLYTFDGGMSLSRIDACGGRVWSTPGVFHHALSLTDDQSGVWTLQGGDRIARVDTGTGEVVQSFSIRDIAQANPGLGLFETMIEYDAPPNANRAERPLRLVFNDPYHLNDVDPLPAALAGDFPGFSPGDLLISARTLNLVFALDPGTLRVRWWHTGAILRQHDPDWIAGGEVMIYDNRMSRRTSRIVATDPATGAQRTLFDGRAHGFYSHIRGKAQRLPGGGLAIASPQQGRVFEVDATGRVVFEMVNTRPGEAPLNYVVTELRAVDEAYFDATAFTCGQ